MVDWYFDKEELQATPSFKAGVLPEDEREYRLDGARFIVRLGKRMALGHLTIATSVVFFQRFYMRQSFKDYQRFVIACCCVLLAGKAEETPKKCNDIIGVARSMLPDFYFQFFGADPKKELITLESILLHTMKFDLEVEHPFPFIPKYAKSFKCTSTDQPKVDKIVQMAWNFVNDSLTTLLCLQWEPEVVAIASLHLSCKLNKVRVADWVDRQPSHKCWWDAFVAELGMDIIEEICHQILDIYQSNEAESGGSSAQKLPAYKDTPSPFKTTTTSCRSTSVAAKGRPGSKHESTTFLAPPLPPLPPIVPPPTAKSTDVLNIGKFKPSVTRIPSTTTTHSVLKPNSGTPPQRRVPQPTPNYKSTHPPVGAPTANATTCYSLHGSEIPFYAAMPPPPPPPPPLPRTPYPFNAAQSSSYNYPFNRSYNFPPPPPPPAFGSFGASNGPPPSPYIPYRTPGPPPSPSPFAYRRTRMGPEPNDRTYGERDRGYFGTPRYYQSTPKYQGRKR